MDQGEDHDKEFEKLISFLCRIPAIDWNETPSKGIGTGKTADCWWVKFQIDIKNPIAWSVVQELGHILNYLSMSEKLPTIFMPVSPPPYMNGGPEDFLSWVIETSDQRFTPSKVAEWLEGRLPKPVEDISAWQMD
jgi:hypothetical protein